MGPLELVPLIIAGAVALWLIRIYCFDRGWQPGLWWRNPKFESRIPNSGWKKRFPRLRRWTRPIRMDYRRRQFNWHWRTKRNHRFRRQLRKTKLLLFGNRHLA